MSRFELNGFRAALVLSALVLGALEATTAGPRSEPAVRGSKATAVPLRLPAAIVYERVVGADSAVTFRHESHVELAEPRCLGCHPEPFRMLQPARRILHADMESGGSCGRCHDGRSAFGVKDSSACQTCHAGSAKPALAVPGGEKGAPGAPAGRRLPGPVSFTRGAASPGPVRFGHETHLQGGGCTSCHPKPYAMKSTGGTPGGAMHDSASCGGCHDGRRAFGVDDAEACVRCHRSQESRP